MSEPYQPKKKKEVDYKLVGLLSTLGALVLYVIVYYWVMITAIVNLWGDHTTNAIWILVFLIIGVLIGTYKFSREINKRR